VRKTTGKQISLLWPVFRGIRATVNANYNVYVPRLYEKLAEGHVFLIRRAVNKFQPLRRQVLEVVLPGKVVEWLSLRP
jgi:hypothetical protein